MSRLPGQRLHSLSEMQLMGQSAQQKAVTKIGALEATMGELQRKQQETDANLLKIIDTIQLQQQALDSVIKRVESLIAEQTAPKRKPGRPRGSKNKPKATGAPEAVPQETAPALGKAAE